MRFVTTATGGKHRELAARLAASFRKWDWPPLTVVSDNPIPGLEKNIVVPGTHSRYLKTKWPAHVPLWEGSVFFIDADCEAVGAFQGFPETSPGVVIGIPRVTYRTAPRTYLLCSAMLGFHSIPEAREIGEQWWSEYRKMNLASDEHALRRAIGKRPVIPCGTIREPLPHLKHRLETTSKKRGWFDFPEIYQDAVDKAHSGSVLVEVGVWQGRSLVHLCKCAEESGKSLRVIGYDQFDPSYYLGAPEKGIDSDQWISAVRRKVPAAQVVRSDSAQAAANHQDGTVFFVFLDAGHTEADLSADIAAWLPKIAPRGILAGHDLDHPKHPAVRAALEKSGLDWKPCGASSWVITSSP